MLEANIKPKTIILERRTPKGEWLFHSEIQKNTPFNEHTIVHAMIGVCEHEHETNFEYGIRAMSSRGIQLMTNRGGIEFLEACDVCNLISMIIPSEDETSTGTQRFFSRNNTHFEPYKALQRLIGENGGIDKFVKRPLCEEDGRLPCGDIYFVNGKKVSVAFY